MVLEFYYDLKSQPCRAIYYLLKAANVDYEPHLVDLLKGDQMKPEFMQLNYFHKVPTIKDGDFVLTECVAILRYIAVKYNVPEHWYPRQDAQKHARVDEFLNWHHIGLRWPCVEMQRTKMRMLSAIGDKTKLPYDEEQLQKLREQIKNSLKQIDEYFLEGTLFISGNEISVADLTGYCEVMQLDAIEEGDLCKSYENITKWIQRVEETVGHFSEASTGLRSVKEIYASLKQ